MNGSSDRPRIFEYENFHAYISEAVAHASRQSSLRGLAKNCGFNSPGYMQRIIKRQILPSADSLDNISQGLRMDADERRYLLLLAEMTRVHTDEQRKRIEEQMLYVRKKANHRSTTDTSLLSSWLNYIVIEMTMLSDFEPTPEFLVPKLSHLASAEEISDTVNFLIANNVIFYEDDRWQKSFATFERIDDQRSYDSQAIHRKALALAAKKLDEDRDKREFQGLTIAIKKEDFDFIKRKLRQVIDEIDLHLSRQTIADDVIQIEIAAFSTIQKVYSREDLL